MTTFLADERLVVPPWRHELAEADCPLSPLVWPRPHTDPALAGLTADAVELLATAREAIEAIEGGLQ